MKTKLNKDNLINIITLGCAKNIYDSEVLMNQLNANILKPGMVWLDAGTTNSLLQASHYVQTIQDRQNIQIGCPEEIALQNNWISREKFSEIANSSPENSYGNHLKKILKNL